MMKNLTIELAYSNYSVVKVIQTQRQHACRGMCIHVRKVVYRLMGNFGSGFNLTIEKSNAKCHVHMRNS